MGGNHPYHLPHPHKAMVTKLTPAQHQADRQALEAMTVRLQREAMTERAVKRAREARGQRVEDGEISWIG